MAHDPSFAPAVEGRFDRRVGDDGGAAGDDFAVRALVNDRPAPADGVERADHGAPFRQQRVNVRAPLSESGRRSAAHVPAASKCRRRGRRQVPLNGPVQRGVARAVSSGTLTTDRSASVCMRPIDDVERSGTS
jgi:hypothetical protein